MSEWLEIKKYVWKLKIKRFFLWFSISKRIKFARALHKYADRISIWEQSHNGEAPPIVWSELHKDYIWFNRFERVDHKKRIKKAVTKLPFSKPNRR